MLRLAVATDAETYERMQSPLADRGIEAEAIGTAERSVRVTGSTSGAGQYGGAFDVGFVFPPRLAEGGVADALLGVPWVNDRECVLRSRGKGETLARLARAGLPTPETVVVSNPVDEPVLKDVFEGFEPPVVVKPNSTTRGTGVALARDLDSFLGVCDYLDLVHDYRATGDRSFLVQEFLPDARDFRVMLIDGEVVGAVERRLPEDALAAGQWKHNVHRGAEATGVDLREELGEQAQAVAEDAADTLEIPWLGVDLLVTGDRVVVNETNARPTIDEATKYEPGFWDDLAALIRSQV
jgi:ribosomal protein S6--L-glutamate ligase